MIEYVGLDVSMKETAICVIDEADRVVAEGKVATCPDAIASFLARHARRVRRVGLETGSLSPWLWRELSQRGLAVTVMDARHVHAALKLQLNKSDRKDAHGLARIVRTGWYKAVEVRSPESQRLRQLLAGRSLLVRQRRDIENQVRGLLKGSGLLVGRVRGQRFAHRVAELIADDPALPAVIEPLLVVRATLLRQLAALDTVVLRSAREDPVTRRLMTMPGVGAITASAYRAAIDDPARFRRARCVGAYLGLTPRRFQSGEVDYTGRISKCGDRTTRSYLYEAANVLISRVPRYSALKAWAQRLAKRVGAKKARVALARKMAVILWRMWVDDTAFRWAN